MAKKTAYEKAVAHTKREDKKREKIEKEYMKNGGIRCPFCKSDNIRSFALFHHDSDFAYNEVTCHDCDRTWHDVYRLCGITYE